jgi:hypothetical protein
MGRKFVPYLIALSNGYGVGAQGLKHGVVASLATTE